MNRSKAESEGGPAQQLASELRRTVWAPSTPVFPIYGKATKIQPNGAAYLKDFDPSKAIVPISKGTLREFNAALLPDP